MKHIALDRKEKKIKDFIRSLADDPGGSVLELNGQPVVRVLPIGVGTVDRAKLKAAILRRRDQSRALNEEWEAVDRETWDKAPRSRE